MINLESEDIKVQKLNELKNIFPEIFEDETINYDKLKIILDDSIESSKSEHYSFNWNGKKECYKTIKAKTNATLKVDEDKDIPDGDNVFIEGDNLEVLKLLQNAYHKKIKMIYIDPPYNKNKDFVYKDSWSDTIQNYKIQTDQLREEGYTSTKTRSTGRRHTNWLNMIYPRLWLSRNLLKDDGVIFVSIDDDEVANLRKVMDEIYGEENFVATFIWKSGRTSSSIYTNEHEYIIAYAKSIESLSLIDYEGDLSYISDRAIKKISIKNPAGKIKFKKGIRFEGEDKIFNNIFGTSEIVEIVDGILECKDNKLANDVTIKAGWVMKDMIEKWMRKEEVYDSKGQKVTEFYFKSNGVLQYVKEKGTIHPKTIIESLSTKQGTNEVIDLMGKKVFDYPKPSSLIQFLMQITNGNDIILDFFAGSGTTAHAVMNLNQEEGGERKYILVQLPEATDEKSEAYKAGYKKISDITKERIKRVIKKLNYKDGFKSFYLDNSNFQVFKEVMKRPNESLESIEKMLKMSIFHENILTQGAKKLDLVYEVGLKNGFTLSSTCKEIKIDKYNFIVLSEETREFYFCFDKTIENDIVHSIPKVAKLICYEKALGDSVKLNLHVNIDLETL